MPAILERLVELIQIKIPDLFSPVDDILRERKASHAWPIISSDINIHPGLNISNETHFLARSIQCDTAASLSGESIGGGRLEDERQRAD